MSRDLQSGVPAGWYVDPQNPRAQRWWSGVGWTEHVHAPATEPARAESTAPMLSSVAAPAAMPTSGGRHVNTEPTLSISSFVDGRYPRHRAEVSAVA